MNISDRINSLLEQRMATMIKFHSHEWDEVTKHALIKMYNELDYEIKKLQRREKIGLRCIK